MTRILVAIVVLMVGCSDKKPAGGGGAASSASAGASGGLADMMNFKKPGLTDEKIKEYVDVISDTTDNVYDVVGVQKGHVGNYPETRGDRMPNPREARNEFAKKHGFADHNDYEFTRLRIGSAQGYEQFKKYKPAATYADANTNEVDVALVAKHRTEIDQAEAAKRKRDDAGLKSEAH